MLNKVLAIPQTLIEGTRGKVTSPNHLRVIKATKVDNLILIKVTSLIRQPSNRVNKPSRKFLLEIINLVLVAGLMAIIL